MAKVGRKPKPYELKNKPYTFTMNPMYLTKAQMQAKVYGIPFSKHISNLIVAEYKRVKGEN